MNKEKINQGKEEGENVKLRPAIVLRTKNAELKPAVAFHKKAEDSPDVETMGNEEIPMLYADRECTIPLYPDEVVTSYAESENVSTNEICEMPKDTSDNVVHALVTEFGLLIDDITHNKPQEGMNRAIILWKKIEDLPEDYRKEVQAAICDGNIEFEKIRDHMDFWRAARSNVMGDKKSQEMIFHMGDGTEYEEWLPGFVKRGLWILYCVDEDKGEYKKLFFCDIHCFEVIDYYDAKGKRMQRLLSLEVAAGDEPQRFMVDMSGDGRSIEKHFREVIGFVNEPGASFETHMKNLLSKLASESPRTKVLVEHGWQRIENKMYYVYDRCPKIPGYKVCCGKYILKNTRYTTLEIWSMAMSVFNQKSVAGPVILYALYGITYRLFVDAKHRPTAILFLAGETGSLKTSICKVFFYMFNTDEDIPVISFQSTPASLDPAILDARDDVLLVDDYCPNVIATQKGRVQIKEVLDRLIRLFGDGTARRKMGSNSKLADLAQAAGGAVANGEIEAEGRSTCLRMITTMLRRKDIDEEWLAIFQNDKSIWSTFLARYIHFLEENYALIVDLIASQYIELRRIHKNLFEERRSLDHYVDCSIINTILCNFLKSEGMSAEEAESAFKVLDEGLLYHIGHSEELSHEQDPYLLMLEGVVNVLSSGAIHIATTEKEYNDNCSYHGYKKMDCVFVEELVLMEEVAKYLKAVRGDYVLDRKHMLKSLSSRYDIIHKFKNGYKNGIENMSLKTKKNKLGNKISMVAVCLQKAEKIVNEQ